LEAALPFASGALPGVDEPGSMLSNLVARQTSAATRTARRSGCKCGLSTWLLNVARIAQPEVPMDHEFVGV
jgi:hypothetical protein